MEAEMEAVAAEITVTVVVTNLLLSSREVAVMVTLPVVAGAVQTPVPASMVPALAVQVIPLVTPPLAVEVKVVEVLTERVGAAGAMGVRATVCGVTVAETLAESPAASVARSQKVFGVVIAAVVMAAPLVGVAERSVPPLVVPTDAVTAFENVGVTVTVAPKSGLVVEGVIIAVAAATTLTVVDALFEESSREVAVIVTVPAVAGAIQAPVPASMVPAVAVQVRPLVTPPVAVAVNVVLVPTVRVGVAGVMGPTTTICGVTVTEVSAGSPAALVVRSQ